MNNDLTNPNYVDVLWNLNNNQKLKVTTQIKDQMFTDWTNLVIELLDKDNMIRSKQVNRFQRIVIEIV